MPLVSRNPVRITRLRFPFAVRVEAWQGAARLRDANARRDVRPGDPFVVPAFAHFDCELQAAPLQPCTITLEAVPDAVCPRMNAIQHDKHWSRTLARLVFEHPTVDWNAARLGEQWQVTQRLVRARLFAEGEALHPIVREQRAARAFYMLALPDARPGLPPARLDLLATESGLRSAAAFASACANLFGVEPTQLLPGLPGTRRAGTPAWNGWPLPATA
ncbi:AraC family transcriptional regulator [Cupriavidus sp. WKF15]|uniref:AraC family transcriptional regulator n=1 Tax=Cupriavidus sp. WKF15 TaxID=3032282 RepID=UPI0023E26554|nr:AraC family transcriptional regulator [Cupriavidus sp. WKF15]WER48589.1 AraC family transcriptional regulator [Cupriavidus sp. WKF15]